MDDAMGMKVLQAAEAYSSAYLETAALRGMCAAVILAHAQTYYLPMPGERFGVSGRKVLRHEPVLTRMRVGRWCLPTVRRDFIGHPLITGQIRVLRQRGCTVTMARKGHFAGYICIHVPKGALDDKVVPVAA
jgi:hypothetical protein